MLFYHPICSGDDYSARQLMWYQLNGFLYWKRSIYPIIFAALHSCSSIKPGKTIGLLYRSYSQVSSSQHLLNLYVPGQTQTPCSIYIRGALWMCCKQCDMGYLELSNMFDLPFLENQNSTSNYAHCAQLVLLPPDIVASLLQVITTPSHLTQPFTLQQPFIMYWSIYTLPDIHCLSYAYVHLLLMIQLSPTEI